jgi:hypothetical protein
MRIGRGAAHGFREGRDGRGAGLSGRFLVGFGARSGATAVAGAGRRGLRGRLGHRRHGSESTGVAAGVKPRSRGAVRLFAQGFTRDDSPGEDEWWWGRFHAKGKDLIRKNLIGAYTIAKGPISVIVFPKQGI